MWSNYHTHSNFCDGKADIETTVAKAQSLKMLSLGMSSHAPLTFDCKWCMKSADLSEYLNTIARLKQSVNDVQVYAGLEVDYIPGVVSAGTFRRQLDYTIGSVHFVEKMSNGVRWEIDGPHQQFLEGLHDIFGNDIRAAVVRYLELTREMVTKDCPSIIGHLDKIKIQNTDDKFYSEEEDWYREEFKKTIACIADAGAIVEVNTRGIYKNKSETTYPSPWILELIRDHNIPITLSSDAHHPDELISEFNEAAFLLRSLGFTQLSVLDEGQWRRYHFNEEGIIKPGG